VSTEYRIYSLSADWEQEAVEVGQPTKFKDGDIVTVSVSPPVGSLCAVVCKHLIGTQPRRLHLAVGLVNNSLFGI